MIKRLALLCCILLLPTIAAGQPPDTNYGDFWVGGQVGGIFTLDRDVDVRITGPGVGLFGTIDNVGTDAGVLAGAIVGYNFCMPNRPAWQRYFGVALDFQWNQFNQTLGDFDNLKGNQFALALLGRLQYPLMGSERFTRGRLVPFIMFGPAVVWSKSDFGDTSRTSTDFALVAEVGLEFFICPRLSIGPSFRYRHVWGPDYEDNIGPFNVKLESNLNQFMVLGRLAYHF
jgi:opacity protein-like surface antigen